MIRAVKLSKQYRIGTSHTPYRTLRDTIVEAMGASVRRFGVAASGVGNAKRSLWALRDVSFEIQPGETVGLIGPNGAGKSTLLTILSRITEPTAGHAELRGRVASLLEVGTGFHAELTGRENVYLNGAILGMKKHEIERKFDEIVAFAEVEEAIDTPVKHYSTGMYLRLAFAVAAHLEPEILMVDEVLAVGDLAFQRRCLGKMGEVAHGGRTVLLVSHNMGMINSLCERAIFLNRGQLEADGPVGNVVQRYIDSTVADGQTDGELSFPEDPELPFQLLAARLTGEGGKVKTQFDLFDPIQVEVDYVIRKSIPGTNVRLTVHQQSDVLFSSWDTDMNLERLHCRAPGRYRSRLDLPVPLLKAGYYQLSFGMGIARVREVHSSSQLLNLEVVEQSVDTVFRAYSRDRSGRLAVPLEWRSEQVAPP